MNRQKFLFVPLVIIGLVIAPKAKAVSKDDYLFGTSYYPEQWPKASWSDDFKKMHDLGFNVVRIGWMMPSG